MVKDHTGVNKAASDLVTKLDGHAGKQSEQRQPEEGRR